MVKFGKINFKSKRTNISRNDKNRIANRINPFHPIRRILFYVRAIRSRKSKMDSMTIANVRNAIAMNKKFTFLNTVRLKKSIRIIFIMSHNVCYVN